MDNRALIERLRRDLTASMFANATDMRDDIEAQRRLAADALERAEAELMKLNAWWGEAEAQLKDTQAELAKYRSAPVVAYRFGDYVSLKDHATDAEIARGAPLIIRPEAPCDRSHSNDGDEVMMFDESSDAATGAGDR